MPDELRLWSGQDGKYQVEASYVCLFQDKKVKLRKPNGALIAVPLNILCKADIAFVSMQSQFVITQHDNNNNSNNNSNLASLNIPSTSSIMTSSSSASSHWNDSALSLKPPSLISTTTTIDEPLQEITLGIQPNVRPLSLSESNLMLPKRSLSSLVQHLSIRHSLITESALELTSLPTKILAHMMSFLDVHSRLTLATLNRHLHSSSLKPSVWRDVYFEGRKRKNQVNDAFIQRFILYLQKRHLDKHITNVILDDTVITAKSIIHIIKHLRNIHTLSLQSCWKVYTYTLAVEFKNMSYSNHHFSRISKVMIGKALYRGEATTKDDDDDDDDDDNDVGLESKSFGQDIWFIKSALDRLARKHVVFDVWLCQTCFSTDMLPLKKCLVCASDCDGSI